MALLDKVSTLQGTESVYTFSNGNTLPLTSMPFGMTSWAPQTTEAGKQWYYHPGHRHFYGLRLTHQPSPWIDDYGHLLLLPQTGELGVDPAWRSSSFRSDEMVSRPDYFRITLRRYSAVMELAPSERSAALKLTFDEPDEARLILAPFEGASSITIDPARGRVTGYTATNSGGVPDNFALYFVLEFGDAIDADKSGLFEPEGNVSSTLHGAGERVGAYIGLRLPESGKVQVNIGTSFISVEQAILNVEREIGERSFEMVRQEAASAWEEKLGVISIEGASEEEQRTFYSCMYRICLFPRMLHEYSADGERVHYSPHNGEVRPGPMYADIGFWDTYRTVFPLHLLLFPALAADMLQAWVHVYEESGWMPKWVSPGERSAMPGTLIDVVFADAVAKGITDFDMKTAYEGLVKHATTAAAQRRYGRAGLDDYKALGYLPEDRYHESVSNSLDYIYGDFCIALMGYHLNDSDHIEELMRRAAGYKTLFDTELGWMRGMKSDGTRQPSFDPLEWGGPFCEGGAWQCSWAVQHDLLGLADLLGGKEAFKRKLDELMTMPPHFKIGSYSGEIHEMSEMAAIDFGQFAISNQPSFHIPYIYTALGYPDDARKWVTKAVQKLFTSRPDGFPGDEDNGSLAAWYIFGAIGFYPLTPGVPEYVLGLPQFSRIRIQLENGRTFTIETGEGQGEANGVQLNGQHHAALYIEHDQIIEGGVLRINPVLSTSEQSEIDEAHLPFSMSRHLNRYMPVSPNRI